MRQVQADKVRARDSQHLHSSVVHQATSLDRERLEIGLLRQRLENDEKCGRQEREGVTFSFVARLTRLTMDHASLFETEHRS